MELGSMFLKSDVGKLCWHRCKDCMAIAELHLFCKKLFPQLSFTDRTQWVTSGKIVQEVNNAHSHSM